MSAKVTIERIKRYVNLVERYKEDEDIQEFYKGVDFILSYEECLFILTFIKTLELQKLNLQDILRGMNVYTKAKQP